MEGRMKRVLLAILFWLSIGVPALAETQSVIDPTDGLEPSKPPAAEKKSAQSDKKSAQSDKKSAQSDKKSAQSDKKSAQSDKKPVQSDAALKRARQRAEAEERRRA